VDWELSLDWRLDFPPLWFLESRLADDPTAAFDERLTGCLTDAGLCS
jgi:hypothetical protein